MATPFVNASGEPYVRSLPINYDHPEQVAGVDAVTNQILQDLARTLGPSGIPGLSVESAYRSPAVNAAVGGAQGSQHMQGKAIDLNLQQFSDEQKAALFQALFADSRVNGIGVYDPGINTMHFDSRSGPRAAWGPDYTNGSLDSVIRNVPWLASAINQWSSGSANPLAVNARPGQAQATPAVIRSAPMPTPPIPQQRPEPENFSQDTSYERNLPTEAGVPWPVLRPGEGPSHSAPMPGPAASTGGPIPPPMDEEAARGPRLSSWNPNYLQGFFGEQARARAADAANRPPGPDETHRQMDPRIAAATAQLQSGLAEVQRPQGTPATGAYAGLTPRPAPNYVNPANAIRNPPSPRLAGGIEDFSQDNSYERHLPTAAGVPMPVLRPSSVGSALNVQSAPAAPSSDNNGVEDFSSYWDSYERHLPTEAGVPMPVLRPGEEAPSYQAPDPRLNTPQQVAAMEPLPDSAYGGGGGMVDSGLDLGIK